MEQPGHAEQGVRAEDERIEKIVVHTPVDHIDTPQACCGAHVNETVVDQQVAAFDQLRANLASQEQVLIESGIVDAGRQERDARVGVPSRSQLSQGLEQYASVMLNLLYTGFTVEAS